MLSRLGPLVAQPHDSLATRSSCFVVPDLSRFRGIDSAFEMKHNYSIIDFFKKPSIHINQEGENHDVH